MQDDKDKPFFFFYVQCNIGGPKTIQSAPRPVEFFPFSDAEFGIYEMLDKQFPTLDVVRTYFSTLLHYDILTTSGGSLADTDDREGLTRVMYRPTTGKVYMDFNTPERLWVTQDMNSFKIYYAKNVEAGIYKSLERLGKHKGEVLDENGFIEKCKEAISEYYETEYPLTPYKRDRKRN